MRRFEDRFWSKVDRSGDCWLWIGTKWTNGYGQFRITGGHLLAHRVAWELTVGPIPEGLSVLHHCDVRACVRPDHLWLGTYADNLADMRAKGRAGWMVKPESTNKGERNGWARFTETDVRAMRWRHAAGETYASIGSDYNADKATIANIVKRRSWKHVA